MSPTLFVLNMNEGFLSLRLFARVGVSTMRVDPRAKRRWTLHEEEDGHYLE